MATAPFTLRLDTKLKKRLEKEAKQQERSAGFIAAKAIERFLDAKQAELRIINAALKEADKGDFVSSEAVDAWMQSWGTENELLMPKADRHFKS